jgi:hypothetical protein
MTRIADITRQTNAATQDTTAAVSYLAELAEQLRASVATFRLPEQSNEVSSLLPQSDNAYPPMINLPDLGSATWGDEIPQLPALPAAPAGAYAGSGIGSGDFNTGRYDYNGYNNDGYDAYYGTQPFTGVPAQQQRYTDNRYGQDQAGSEPRPSDLYQ